MTLISVMPPSAEQVSHAPQDASVLTKRKAARIGVLDGWRGISILCVLAGHLFPLGPARFQMNECLANLGMTLFFTLSGFLITTTLIDHPSTRNFLIRRICRIVPLAWLFMLAALTAVRAPWQDYPAHLLFYADLPPFWLVSITGHLWSLCVEMQFYMVTALLFGLLGRRGLYLLPVLGASVTLARILTGTHISIVSYLRADEILAGASLALVYSYFGRRMPPVPFRAFPLVLLALAVVACHPQGGAFNYLRPYFGSALVGCTMSECEGRLGRFLRSKRLAYVAEISYSLYVLHVIAMAGWFNPDSKIMKYARRPIGLALVWLLAHCSTYYYESRWIQLGKRLTHRSVAAA